MPNFDLLILFDLLGFIISLSSVAVVANAAQFLKGPLRLGMLSLLWGLAFITISFVWAIIIKWFMIFSWPDLRPVLLSFGMTLLLLSVTKLFSIYRPDNV